MGARNAGFLTPALLIVAGIIYIWPMGEYKYLERRIRRERKYSQVELRNYLIRAFFMFLCGFLLASTVVIMDENPGLPVIVVIHMLPMGLGIASIMTLCLILIFYIMIKVLKINE